ncbi:replication initiation protein, partial [Erwinia amylovora]|nr:replication initiation protein [Erwinia amylovora]
PRRPRAAAGSELEGAWARRCIAIMEQYRDCLITYDRTEKVPLTDVRKLAGWYKIIGDKIACKRVMSEVNARAKK